MGGFFYGRYTKEQVERANQVDLEELLLRSGEKLLRSGREKRLESDHSVTIRGNEWYDHAAEEGGFALSFTRKHFGLSFQEAMALLLGENGQAPLPTAKPKPEPSKPFVLPPAAGNQRRVFGYLLGTRQIDRAVLSAFVRKGLVYEDLPCHNAVFVGMDAAGFPGTPISGAPTAKGSPSASMWREAIRPTASTGWEPVSSSMCSKRPSTCSRISPCTRRVGSGTAM